MSYKIKSLIYFFCFLATTTIYYAMDNENQDPNNEGIAELQQVEPTSLDMNSTPK